MQTEHKCEVCGVLLHGKRLDMALVSLAQPGLAWCWEVRGRVKDKGQPWVSHPDKGHLWMPDPNEGHPWISDPDKGQPWLSDPNKGHPWVSHPSKGHPHWFVTPGSKITQILARRGPRSLLCQGKAHPGCSFLRDAHPNPSCTAPLLLPHSQEIYSSVSPAPSQEFSPMPNQDLPC